jgi:methyl-accepting chemotaxis protein
MSSGIQKAAAQTHEVSSNVKEITYLLQSTQFGNTQSSSVSNKLTSVAQEMNDAIRGFKLEQAKFEILQIKQQHLAWFQRVLEGIQSPETLAKTDVSKATECFFGKWFYGDGKRFESLPVYREIEKVHNEVHSIAHSMVEHIKAGDVEKAKSQMVKFNQAWQTLFVKIDRLYQS